MPLSRPSRREAGVDVPEGEAGWEALRLGALASSLMDGLSVWLRELRRPSGEQSPGVIRHETDRAGRLVDLGRGKSSGPGCEAS